MNKEIIYYIGRCLEFGPLCKQRTLIGSALFPDNIIIILSAKYYWNKNLVENDWLRSLVG